MFNRKDRIERALRVTLERFEQGRWISGTMYQQFSDSYCLVGSLRDQLTAGVEATRLMKVSELPTAYHQAIHYLGFKSEREAYTFNDFHGRDHVVRRLRDVLDTEFGYGKLHRALDDSRVAHAERDLGRKIPNVVPLAWVEQQFSETFAEEVQV